MDKLRTSNSGVSLVDIQILELTNAVEILPADYFSDSQSYSLYRHNMSIWLHPKYNLGKHGLKTIKLVNRWIVNNWTQEGTIGPTQPAWLREAYGVFDRLRTEDVLGSK